MTASPEVFEAELQRVGGEIFELSGRHQMGLFDKGYWSGKMMEWAMNYPEFKVEMFRFVDVLPSLHDSDQVAEHIRQYFLRPGLNFPGVIRAGLGVATSSGLAAKFAAASIRKNVTSMASTFITGTDAASARKTLEKLWNAGFCFTVDILGEAAVAESEALDYQRRYLDLVQNLSRESKSWQAQPRLEEGPSGSVPRANVSVKCSSLYSQIDNMAFSDSVEKIKERLRPILLAAVENGVFVNLDMEQNDFREMFMTVADELFVEEPFRKYPHLGIVVQAYLKSAQGDIARVLNLAKQRGTPLTVRLVKGAYWDYEVIQSLQKGWEIPVFTSKAATDANYERCTELLLGAYPHIHSAFGSHNVRNIAFAATLAQAKGLPKNAFEFQMLYGMAEPFKKALSSLGYRVREYAPVGEILPGMAYLVRRLLENTSNEGFLRAKFVQNVDTKILLSNPALRVPKVEPSFQKETHMFQNEAYQDFTQAPVREAMERAIQKVRKELPIVCDAIVGGKVKSGLSYEEVKNPSYLSETVSKFALSGTDVAEEAVKLSELALKTWGTRAPEERIAVIRRAGELIRARKNELSAVMVVEIAKNFREADADVAEAIDFCLYYAQEMEHLAKPKDMGSTPGESNKYLYQPRGTTVSIAPWNFPLAILCGMTVGPLVAEILSS